MDFESHRKKCTAAKAPNNRRFYVIRTTGNEVNGLLSVSILGENHGASDARLNKDVKKRSPNLLWYPYKSGAIPKDTSVCFEYPVSPSKVCVLNGVTAGVAKGLEVTVDVDGTKHKVDLTTLYLLRPIPTKPRRAQSMKTAACGFKVKAVCHVRTTGLWEITILEKLHTGHPSSDGKLPLKKKQLANMPEVKNILAEFEAAKIPAKYLSALVEVRIKSKYTFRPAALNLLANIDDSTLTSNLRTHRCPAHTKAPDQGRTLLFCCPTRSWTVGVHLGPSTGRLCSIRRDQPGVYDLRPVCRCCQESHLLGDYLVHCGRSESISGLA